MRNAIFISTVTSTILLATNVTNLTVDNISKVDTSNIINARVNQGRTNIDTLGGTNSEVENINIQQKDGAGSGNIISNSTIGDGGYVRIEQGATFINDSKVSDLELVSTNKIDSSTITDSRVGQGFLWISDSNITDSTANSININSNNKILNANIDNSNVLQSGTGVVSGSDIHNLNLKQTNNIMASNGTSDINSSMVIQAGSLISSSYVENMKEDVSNDIKNVDFDDSVLKQAQTDIYDSLAINLDLAQDNDILNTNMNSATLAQGYTNIQ